MIISKFVTIRVRNKSSYWSTILNQNLSYHDVIDVSIKELPLESNKRVRCSCDICSKIFERQYQLVSRKKIHHCYECSRVEVGKLNSVVQSNVKRPWQLGELHPRWNPSKSEFKKYSNRVHWLTRKHDISSWKNFDKIGRCGEKGAYQVDHKVSIKYGFDNHIVPELIASVKNLEIIPWKKNRTKHKANSIDLWDILS